MTVFRRIIVAMNKGRVTAIIVLMVLALGSLIAMQAYWIRNALALREQQFNVSVSEALLNVAQEVEQKEALELMMSNSWMQNNVQMMSQGMNVLYEGIAQSDPSLQEYLTGGIAEEPQSGADGIMPEVDLNVDTILAIDSSCHVIYQSTVNIQVNDSVRTFTITHTDRDHLEKQLTNNKQKMASKMDQVNDLFFKYFGLDRNPNDRIKEDEIVSLINEELKYRGINTKYEYIVLSDYGMPIIKSENYIPEMLNSSHRVMLFPNDLFSDPSNLMVYFPDQRKFIISSLGFMSASSIGLILVISLCFAYTIYVIFRQKKLSDMKNDFINNMTHELKTPVATISLASEMLMDDRIQGDQARLGRFASVIHEENKRLGGQVEKVLQMAVLDKGEFKLNITQVNVHEVVQKLCDKFSLRMEERGGTCHLDLSASQPFIDVDEVHFSNIITNLLDNAIKYSSDAPDVTITTRDAVGGIKICVKDKGIGMNREQQKRVFERFYRVPTGNIHNVKGFGLGLSYVKAMVEAHGGDILLKSELHKGSSFEVFMPYKASVEHN